jgi:hypothetical protein
MAKSIPARTREQQRENNRKVLAKGIEDGTIKVRKMTEEERLTGVVKLRTKPQSRRR